MCDYVEEAMFDAILRERNLERKRLYLERCLKQLETARQEQEVGEALAVAVAGK